MIDGKKYEEIISVVEEAKRLGLLSLEELKSKASQFENVDGCTKDMLINVILKNSFDEAIYRSYLDYLRYASSASSRKVMEVLDQTSSISSSVIDLFEERNALSREKMIAERRQGEMKSIVELEIPLIRVKIEYDKAKGVADRYLRTLARNGVKLASMEDELDKHKSRFFLYRLAHLRKGQKMEEAVDSFREQSKSELDVSSIEYEKATKEYHRILKDMFFKMLDNKKVAEAILLYTRHMIDCEYGYAVESFSDAVIEDKDEIFNMFLKYASFNPEEDMTGDLFHEKVVGFVCRYYELMYGRMSIQQSRIIGKINDLVEQQKELQESISTKGYEDDIKNGFFTKDQTDTYALVYAKSKNRL